MIHQCVLRVDFELSLAEYQQHNVPISPRIVTEETYLIFMTQDSVIFTGGI